jgi:hypothetical protein
MILQLQNLYPIQNRDYANKLQIRVAWLVLLIMACVAAHGWPVLLFLRSSVHTQILRTAL